MKPQLVIVVLKKIVKPQSVTVFKDISETTVKITILTTENWNETWFKNIFETTISNCGSKENCKNTVCDCGFMVIMINKILKIILKSQY